MSDFIKNTERIKTLYNFVYGNNSGGVNSTKNMLNERRDFMTYDEFVEKAHKIHKNPDGTPKYTGYDNKENRDNWVGYRKTKDIKLKCPHQHEFKVTARFHVPLLTYPHQAQGCPICKKKEEDDKRYNEFVEKAKEIHKNPDGTPEYSGYEDVKKVWGGQVRNTPTIKLYCGKKLDNFPDGHLNNFKDEPHGEFVVTPKNHINNLSSGCPICDGNHDNKYTWLDKVIKKKFHKKDGKLRYNYTDTNYISAHKDVKITCPKKNHGEFLQTPNDHLFKNHGCPICRASKGEQALNEYLVTNGFGSRIPGKTFSDCVGHPSSKGTCRRLPFDFYLPEQKIVIEIDGEGHFYGNFRGNTEIEKFERQKQYDTKKDEFVRKNKGEVLDNGEIINYLIRIAYLDGNTEKVIKDFKNAFKKIKKNPPKGYEPIIYSDGYPNPNTKPEPEPVLDTPEDFEKIENDKNLKENISRIKQMMGLINEYIDIPYDEKENTGSTENKPIELIGGLKQDPPEIDKPPAWKKENNTIQLFNRDRLNFRNFIQNILPNVNLKFLGGGAIGVAFVPIGNYTLPTDFTQNNFYGVIPPKNTPVVFKFTANSTEVKKIKNLIEKPNNPGLVNYYWIKEVDLPSELQYSTTYGPSKDLSKDERKTQWIKQETNRYWETPEPQRKDFKLTPKEIKAGERKLNNELLRKQKEKRTKFKKLYIVCLDKINRIPPELKPILNFCFRYYYWIQFEHKKENVKGYRNFKPISVIRSNYLNDRAMRYFYYKIVLRKDVEYGTMSSNQPTYEEFVQWFPKLLSAIEKVYRVGKAKTFDLHDGNMGLDDNGNIVFFDVYV